MNNSRLMKGLLFSVASLTLATTAQASNLCATDADRAIIATELKKGHGISLEKISDKTGISIARLIDALPAERRTRVAGDNFTKIWEMMRTWRDAQVVVEKAGSYFTTRGRLPEGAPSVFGSKFFNLNPNTLHIGGHLRPDAIAAIYAAKVPSTEGEYGAVLAFDVNGEAIFRVLSIPDGTPAPGQIPVTTPEMVAEYKEKQKDQKTASPAEHKHEEPEAGWYPKEFLTTMAKMGSLPQVCRS